MDPKLQKDLEKNIKHLKSFLSNFNTIEVMGFIANTMMFHKQDLINKTGLSSPHKQLLYLAGLLLSTDQRKSKSFKESDFKKVKKYLEKITTIYALNFFPLNHDNLNRISDHWKRIIDVTMPVFLNYFNTTPLYYEEQIIERIEKLFSPFDSFLKEKLGTTAKELVDIIKFIQIYIQKQFDELFKLKQKAKALHEDFFNTINQKEIKSIDHLRQLALEHPVYNAFKNLTNKIQRLYIVPISSLRSNFNNKIVEMFCNNFCIKRKRRDFKYYTESNPVENSPIWMYTDSDLFIAFIEQLFNAIYNFLYTFLENSELKEKFYRHRDKYAENEALKIFIKLFKDKGKYYTSLFETKDSQYEHDLIIQYDNKLILVEVKAAKFREPFRDPERAFVRIEREFKSDKGIQKGYDQGLRLKQIILSNDETHLFDKNGNIALKISKDNIEKIYIVILTLEQMGILGCNLSLLLDKPENEPYPFSTNLYDLENIIEGFIYFNYSPEKFLDYLDERSKLHEKFMAWDELEIAGFYLVYKGFDKIIARKLDLISFTPDMASIFDKIYFEKHGLDFDYDPDPEPFTIDVREEIKNILLNSESPIHNYKIENKNIAKRKRKKFEKERKRIRKINKRKRKK